MVLNLFHTMPPYYNRKMFWDRSSPRLSSSTEKESVPDTLNLFVASRSYGIVVWIECLSAPQTQTAVFLRPPSRGFQYCSTTQHGWMNAHVSRRRHQTPFHWSKVGTWTQASQNERSMTWSIESSSCLITCVSTRQISRDQAVPKLGRILKILNVILWYPWA